MASTRPFAYNVDHDWFLPSTAEAQQMYDELAAFAVGDFAADIYWTSTQATSNNVNTVYMVNGATAAYGKGNQYSARACRQFIDSLGAYSLRDTGPKGGLIFNVSGGTSTALYHEAYPVDQSNNVIWSNINELLGPECQGGGIGDGKDNTWFALMQGTGCTAGAIYLADQLNTGTTAVARADTVGQVTAAWTGQTDRYDLFYSDLFWWMGPDEDPGYVIGYRVPLTSQPEFWRTDSKTDALFLNYSNYIRRINGDGQTFSNTSDAYTWLTANGYWTTYSGQTTLNGFVITVDTTITTGAATLSTGMTIPAEAIVGDWYVDWGDGSGIETFTTSGNKYHGYSTGGEYQISITGGISHLRFGSTNDHIKVISLDQWGDNPWAAATYMFYGCENMVANYSDTPDMSNVTGMQDMFYDCRDFNGSLAGWDTSNVTRMDYMFYRCQVFDNDISDFDTRKVTHMPYMFSSCNNFNQSLNHFVMSGVTYPNHMFYQALSFNGAVDQWDMSSAINMSYLFMNSSFAQDLTNWNTSNNTDFHAMFYGCDTFNHDISSFDTRKAGRLSSMFRGCTAFNQPVDHFVTTGVTDLHETFYGCTNFNQHIGNWVTGPDLDATDYMFYQATSFNKSISGITGTHATDMTAMFRQAEAFNQPIDSIQSWNATSVAYMFEGADAFKQDLSTLVITGTTGVNSIGSICLGIDINETDTTTNYDNTLVSWYDQVVEADPDENTITGRTTHFSNSKYGSGWSTTGTTNVISGNTLYDSTNDFTVYAQTGDIAVNLTTGNYARVLYVSSSSAVGVSTDIFTGSTGDSYAIFQSPAAKAHYALIYDYGWTINDAGYSWAFAFPTRGLEAAFNFEESSGTVFDLTENSNNLTSNSSVTYGVTGKNGDCVTINGYLLGSKDTIGGTEFSISCWVKTGGNATNQFIFDIGDVDWNQGYSLVLNASEEIQLWIYQSVAADTIGLSGTPSIGDDEWHHVVVTYLASGGGGGTCKFYLDGDYYAPSGSNLKTMSAGYTTFRVGSSNFLTTNDLEGEIDNLFIYSVRLSASEVSALYNNGNGMAYPT